jgi:transposase
MPRAYSQDLRVRVLAAVEGGMRVYAAAPVFGVSVSYIYKARARQQRTGETTLKPQTGRTPKLTGHDEALRARLADEPDATLAELQAWLAADRNVNVSIGCLWNRLKHLGLTLKKSHNAPPSRTVPMWPRRGHSGAPAKAA